MKKRILSFVLMLAMLFSCLSLEIFAASGEGAAQSTGNDSKASQDVTQQAIAEYFKEHGTIANRTGSYNLTASELVALVGSKSIFFNKEFEAWTDYSNATGNLSLGGNSRVNNDKNGERIVPVTEGDNHYFLWLPRTIATHSDGSYFEDFTKNENGEYNDSVLQTYVSKNQVEIVNGEVFYVSNRTLSSDYIQIRDAKLGPSNLTTNAHVGQPYTIAFDLKHTMGVASGSIISHLQSASASNFGTASVNLGLEILSDGTLQANNPATGRSESLGYQFKNGEWAQIAITHLPRGLNGVRDIDSSGNHTASYDDNVIQIYVNGELLKTYGEVVSDGIWASNGTQVSAASDFTFYSLRIGQSSQGIALDDLRVYYSENVELASKPHTLTYTHKHDLSANQRILIATCTDEGCGASEELVVDLCDKSGVSKLSVADVSEILEAAGRNAWVLADFTGGKIAELSYSDGVYREDSNADGVVDSKDDTLIQWVNIAYKEDASGNERAIWQRPIANNPATDKPFTEAEAATLSETAQSRITFENGIPYYTGSLSSEYLHYSDSSVSKYKLPDMLVSDPANEAIGRSYAITMDFTYYGGSFSPLQIRSYTKDSGEGEGVTNLDSFPIKITDGQLFVIQNGKLKAVEGVSFTSGETVQLSFVHMPRGLDGERDVENGYSSDDDNTILVFVNGNCVVSSKLTAETAAPEWNYTPDENTSVAVSPTSDFTIAMIRIGQISSKVTQDLFAIDNLKVYLGAFVECNHHFTTNPAVCDWCGKGFDLQYCSFCDGSTLADDVILMMQNATIGEAIAYNVYLKLDKDVSDFGDDTIVLDTTADGGTRRVEYRIADLLPETSGDAKGLYKVSIALRSIDMTRAITIGVNSDESETSSKTVVLNSYLDALLEVSISFWVRNLVKAMKNYGSYAQLYFEGKNGNPDDLGELPNANLSDKDKTISDVSAEKLLSYKTVISGDCVEIESLKLVLDSATELRILFRDEQGIAVSENGKTLTKVASEYEGYSYVSLIDASPISFGKAHTVVFTKNGEQTTVSVSAYSVLYVMLSQEDEQLVDLACAMYQLGEAASKYKYYFVDGNADKKQAWDEDGVLKLLCIGNSFSIDAMEWIGEIADDLGYTEVVFGNLYIGGCYIDKHIAQIEGNTNAYTYYIETGSASTGLKKKSYPEYQAINAIVSENWDFISMQQGSSRSFTESEYANLKVLADYVTELCPSATFVWHMTWAYQEEYAMEKKNITQMQMYEGILNCVQKCVMDNETIDFDTLVPSGTAIQNARTSYLGNDLTRDGYHLDRGISRYIAALTFFAVLTGEDISKVEWAPTGLTEGTNVDAAARAVAIESVLNAIANPYEVTPSQYTTPPQE